MNSFTRSLEEVGRGRIALLVVVEVLHDLLVGAVLLLLCLVERSPVLSSDHVHIPQNVGTKLVHDYVSRPEANGRTKSSLTW